MKRKFFAPLLVVLLLLACSPQEQNPFYTEWDTPFGIPPFSEIKEEHYMPAMREGIIQHQAEIEAIANSTEHSTFENTVLAMEYSGELLDKVTEVFFSLNSAITNEQMQTIAKEAAPMLSEHSDNIILNDNLFKRIKAIHETRLSLALTPEQDKLLDEYYKRFVRNGADLNAEDKEKLRAINKELSVITLQFGENILKETNNFEMVLEDEKDLAGLPDFVVSGAAEAAAAKGYEGKWLFTLHKPSWIPFLQYSERRDLREKIYRAWFMMGDNGDDLDNKKIIEKIVALRLDRSNLLGYKTYSHFALEESMAKVPENVYDLLAQIWTPALNKAKEERALFQAVIDRDGGGFKLESWDWWYYAEKLKKEKYDLDDEVLKPYFQLENVLDACFMVCNKLWGITFNEIKDAPVYHEDVRVFEVKEEDGAHIGIFFCDYFPRASKRGGAWMGTFRKQSRTLEGEMVAPLVYNVGNFSKPTGDMPSLLTFDEVRTLFHEMGHGLHGLLSNGSYPALTGTAVVTDFVELPSQIMENWATDPAVLKLYAKHYKTGEPIPDELIAKIKKADKFNQGFFATEYLAASLLDMDYHTIDKHFALDVRKFENDKLGNAGLIPEIKSRYRSTYFRHIFTSGYASGYYSYIWAEVLDADAFQAFRENGIFDRQTAQLFRENILAKGGSEDPMKLYVQFRGSIPSIQPLLERRGLN
ncbi:MAG: M3 family metallopeptidase [Candidatus Krumholzibacteria bacterium]|nr:M3 family metallopeptidase [Candidatus Krumholzibacteria bacterium]